MVHSYILPHNLCRVAALSSLTVLCLNDNELTNLPASVGALKKLRALSVSNNALQRLPTEIGELESLVELRLDGNIIRRYRIKVWGIYQQIVLTTVCRKRSECFRNSRKCSYRRMS